ncbi:MAG: hypothetical protein ACRDSJ_08280 [Rubrobacteraceae bacterium]
MTASTEPPKQPYILLFEGGSPDSLPLAVVVSDRSAIPLFDSRDKAAAFLDSTGLREEFSPVEVSTAGLIETLEAARDHVEHIAINPPPASEGGMRVRMGKLVELIEALREGRDEVDLFDFLGENGAGR